VAPHFIIVMSIWLAVNVAFVALRLWVTRPLGLEMGRAGSYQLSEIRLERRSPPQLTRLLVFVNVMRDRSSRVGSDDVGIDHKIFVEAIAVDVCFQSR